MADTNSIFAEFAGAFAGKVKGDGEIAFVTILNRAALDYSLDSLNALDQYLDHLHQNKDQISKKEYHLTVLRGGAYLGEVIKRNTTKKYSWMDYEVYMRDHENQRAMIPNYVGTCAILVHGGAMTMPLNKVLRFIEEGPDNNTHYYASVEVRNT